GAGRDITGTLEGEMAWEGKGEALSADIQSAVQELAEGLGTSEVTLRIAYDLPKDEFSIPEMKISHPKIGISGNAHVNLASGVLKADLETTPSELNAWDASLQGTASMKAVAGGTLDAPEITADISTHNVVAVGQALPDATTQITAKGEGEDYIGQLDIKASDGNSITARYLYGGDALTLTDIAANYLGAVITGQLAVNTKSTLASGKLNVQVADVSRFSGLVPQLQGGKADADITLQAKNSVQHATVLAHATALDIDGTVIDKAMLSASGTEKNMQVALNASGRINRPWQLDGKAAVTIKDGKNWQASFGKFQAKRGSMEIVSHGKAWVKQEGSKQSFEFSNIAVAGGNLKAQGSMDANTANITVHGSTLALRQLDAQLPQEFENARSDFDLTIKGDPASPQADAKLTVSGIRAHEAADNIQLNATAILPVSGNTKIQAKIQDGASAHSDIQLQLPVKFSLQPFVFAVPEQGVLSGTASLAMDMAALAAAVLPPQHVLKGNVTGKLTIGGTVGQPQITGDIRMADGSYKNLSAGASLPHIDAHIVASGSRFKLSEFSARDEKDNTLHASGQADITGDGVSYRMRAEGKNIELLQHAQARGIFSLDMSVEGDARAGKVAGAIVSEQLDIFLPDYFAESVPELNVVKILPEDIKEKPSSDPYALTLDMTFKADNKVFVRGRGVDAELKGDLTIKGTAAQPDIEGKLSTIRGRYEEFGKNFSIQKGELLFDGDMPPSPYITIVAAHAVNGTEIRPVLSGPVGDPTLKVESTPSMPQDEALSLLLFGEDTSKISPLQAVQLADSLRRLSGKGGGGSLNPVGAVRDLLGVDDLTVNNDGSEASDTSVGVGKYISDDVYLQIEQGADSTSSRAKIEVELSDKISVESSTGATGSNKVGVNYKYDY
ncbi:MAG: translocation/assembly module TamB domain-containing protein, partial [Alphaproteobacteria bacterium]